MGTRHSCATFYLFDCRMNFISAPVASVNSRTANEESIMRQQTTRPDPVRDGSNRLTAGRGVTEEKPTHPGLQAQQRLSGVMNQSASALALARYAMLLNSGGPPKPQLDAKDPSDREVVQRAVPQGHIAIKPVAEAGSYVARGGQNIPFNSAHHPRSQFSFGAHTRNAVFERYNPTMVGNRIVSIRAHNGEQVNVEGVQLDHQVSWANISATMDANNQSLIRPFDYSLWDAKMYYNDLGNLVPALGALNAAAGVQGVGEVPRIHGGLELSTSRIQLSWMNLQAGLTSTGVGMSEDAVERVATLLFGVAHEMDRITEQLF
jgi:hypothetical protein